MIGILRIGSLRSPPFPAAPDFPLCRGQNKTSRNTLFINGSAVSTGYCATELQGWQRRYKKWRRRRRTSPAQRYYITPEGGALNPPVRRSRSQAEPWQPRAERPGGWLNPHARKGVSTFGNTGKHRSGPDPDRKAAPFVSRETFQKTQPVHMTRCVFISNFPAGSRWGLRRRR